MHSEDLSGALRHCGQYSVDPPELFPVKRSSFRIFPFVRDVIQRVGVGDELCCPCSFSAMINDQVAGNAKQPRSDISNRTIGVGGGPYPDILRKVFGVALVRHS